MPTAAPELRDEDELAPDLAPTSEESDQVRRLKGRVLHSLQHTRTWRNVARTVQYTVVVARPPSMLRRVDFDYSPDVGGLLANFAPAPEDDSDISW